METSMTNKQIRHDVSEIKNQLQIYMVIKNVLGGEEEFNKLLKTLESVEKKLGDKEVDLEEGRLFLDDKFEENIKLGVSLIQPLLKDSGNQSGEAEGKEMREKILNAFSPLVDENVSITRPSKVQQIKEAVLKASVEGKKPVTMIPVTGISTKNVVQCVYQDNDVKGAFELKHWVCMCDMVEEHPSKLLDLLFRQQAFSDEIFEKFHSVVDGKKYLLVLDGVMQVDLGFMLNDLLCNVLPGSKIIVTASAKDELGNFNPLSRPDGASYEVAPKDQQIPQDVWDEFSSTSKLNDGDEKEQKSMTAKDICVKYANNPCLLKILAFFLSSKKTAEEWKDVLKKLKKSSLKGSSSILKHMTYTDEILSNIFQCQEYCWLFPKDYPFVKKDLIHLWVAQANFLSVGKELPLRPQELVGEEYFSILHSSGFFSEKTIEKDGTTFVLDYNMLEFVIGFLKELVKDEICSFNEPPPSDDCMGVPIPDNDIDLPDKLQHVSFMVNSSSTLNLRSLKDAKVKSLLFLSNKLFESACVSHLDEVLPSLTSLKALNLASVNCENLSPDVVKQLKDLRYLKLGTRSKGLLQSITMLQNLQTLDLRHSGVIELPDNFYELKNLRHLYTGGKLIDMPTNFGKLTSLQTLDLFIVGEINRIDALGRMKDLTGELAIRFEKVDENEKWKILKTMCLTDLSLVWSSLLSEPKDYKFDFMELPVGLKSITLCHWKGESFPQKFVIESNIFNSLVSIRIEDCSGWTDLAGLSTLPHLKYLQLWDLPELESIDGDRDVGGDGSTSTSSLQPTHYFSSLEYVMLAHLKKFTGWSSSNSSHFQQRKLPIPSPRLELCVSGCKNMEVMPLMRCLVSLVVHDIKGSLLKHILSATTCPSPSSTLKKLEISRVNELEATLSISKLTVLESLTIRQCKEVQKLILESLSSLQRLEIHECGKLEDIDFLEDQPPALKILEIKHCEKLALMKNNSETSWKCFKNLHSLKLMNILNLNSLEKGLCSLEKLEDLFLHSIYELRALPEWIVNLKQLGRLFIRNCPFILTLPESLGNHSVLEQVELHQCPKLIKQLLNSKLPKSLTDELKFKTNHLDSTGLQIVRKKPEQSS